MVDFLIFVGAAFSAVVFAFGIWSAVIEGNRRYRGMKESMEGPTAILASMIMFAWVMVFAQEREPAAEERRNARVLVDAEFERARNAHKKQ